MLKLYAIACEALMRECCRSAAISPHIVTLSFQKFGLHDTPSELRRALQQKIDSIPENEYDYFLLAYGLCSRGTADLVCRSTPIVIPRAHDCITLLLGSRQRYDEEFRKHPGTYYYSSGWIERKIGDSKQGNTAVERELQNKKRFREYVEKYGEENARYLMEQENNWIVNYDRAVFVNMGLGNNDYYRAFTRQIADANGWAYEEIQGDSRLIDRLFAGDWDDEFLTVQPGQHTSENVINAGIISAR